MGAMASLLNQSGRRPTLDLVLKFLEHFAAIRDAMDTSGVWDAEEGLYYDKLVTPDGTELPIKVRSMVGVIPLLAAIVVDGDALERASAVGKRAAEMLERLGGRAGLTERGLLRGKPGSEQLLL